uniref:Caspase-1 n=1 Tax=Capra hircus TaxID=9925 RepID=A0A8C2RM32_CAPHI
MADKVLKEKRKLFVHSVSKDTINGLLDELLQKRVLNQGEMEKIRDENITTMDKARVLIDIVICKGPRACQICISHICEEDSHLAGILGLTSGSQSENYLRQESQAVVHPFPAPQAMQDNPVKLASSGPGWNLKLCPPETAQRIWKEKSGEIYPIMERSNRTRLALIICNIEFENLPRRDGADVDTRNMKVLLEGLGYKVDVKENLTASEMILELKAFAARSEHRTSDSTFLVLMSHGIRAGICGKKYSEEVQDILKIDDIFQILNTLNCPALGNKPKVIIIQACRGEKQGVVWVNDSVAASGNCPLVVPEDFDSDAIKKAHIEKDFIAFCSSTPEDKHNKNPLKTLESLGKELISGLLDDFVEKNVLKLEEEEKKKIYDAKLQDKARVLVDSIRQKNQEAGQVFVQTFLNIDKNSTNIKAPEETVAGPDESAGSAATLKLCPHEEFLKLCKERAGEIYPIKERKDRTRLALIICNTEFDHLPPRNGADLDILGMKQLLEGLGYTVEVEEKLTARDMESVLWKFAAREEHKSSDSTFLVFMSHGILDGICGTMHSDEEPDVLPYDTIFRTFNNRNCLSLKDKPKVIIVQACRGANRGELWVSDSPAALADSFSQSPENLEEDAVYKTHVEKDFIAFCSSTPHNVSWRDIKKGSLFITQLITCFQKYAWCCHLEEVFRKVQQSFEKPNVKAQMPTVERLSMTRYFYLFPGN